ncbi:MAG TPA: M56 family metallopeptidase, partial [Planctomycetaceae bacterium]|nr:M56 family metallopeptidase [Planctomycetaceae bacterium]
PAMPSFTVIVASNVVLSALLALLAVVVTRIWRNPHLAHGLWLLVLLKLITPPFVHVTLPEPWFAADHSRAELPVAEEPPPPHGRDAVPAAGMTHAMSAAPLQSAPELEPAVDPPLVLLPDRETGLTGLIPPPEPGQRSHEPDTDPDVFPGRVPVPHDLEALSQSSGEAAEAVPSVSTAGAASAAVSRSGHGTRPSRRLMAGASAWEPLLFAAWAAGILVSAAIAVRRTLRFRQIIDGALDADAHLSAETERLAGAFGLRHAPRVRIVPARIPPLVWCCGLRPLVLLPRELLDGLNPAERRTVLAHELAHIRRGDHLVRWLEALVLAVFWWNPVAWYARRRLRQAEEECCDARVVSALPADRRSYGQALLRTIEFLTEGRPLPSVAGSAFGGFPVTRRIEMILKRNATPKMSRSALAAMLLVTALVLPVAAQVASTAVSTEPVPGASSAAPAEDAPDTVGAEPAAAQPPTVTPVFTELPPASAPPAADSRTVPTEAFRRSADRSPEPGSLEARLERLERLVETLIAERRSETRPTVSSFQSDSRRPQHSDSKSSEAALPPQNLATVARRVAVSRDGKLAAVLTTGSNTSLAEIHAVESGGVLSVLSVAGRATDIRFSAGGNAVSVKIGSEWTWYAVPDGWELLDEPSETAPASSPASVAPPAVSEHAPHSPFRKREQLQADVEAARAKLAAFLAEWEPQERLLKIDLQQAELKLQAAQTRLKRAQSLKDEGTVGPNELDDYTFASRQAQLDVERAATQLDIHQQKRKAAELELKQTVDGASKDLEGFLKRNPAAERARN